MKAIQTSLVNSKDPSQDVSGNIIYEEMTTFLSIRFHDGMLRPANNSNILKC